MKTYLLIFVVLLFACGNSQQPVKTVENTTAPTESVKTIKSDNPDTKRHFTLVSQVFSQLKIDSLNSNDGEAYRIIILKGTSLGETGNPIAITFYKKAGKKTVLVKELFEEKGNINEINHPVSATAFDSISNMFNNYFWGHDITDYNCDHMVVNGTTKFYESFKDGKHKLISQTNCPDPKLLPFAYFNFFIFSEYSKIITEDFIWFKNNPPNNIKTPGPPSSLKNK